MEHGELEATLIKMLGEIRREMQYSPLDAHIHQAREQVCVAVLRAMAEQVANTSAELPVLPALHSFLQAEIIGALREAGVFAEVRWRKNVGLHISRRLSQPEYSEKTPAPERKTEQLPLPLFAAEQPALVLAESADPFPAQPDPDFAAGRTGVIQLNLFSQGVSAPAASTPVGGNPPDLWAGIAAADLFQIIGDCLKWFTPKRLAAEQGMPFQHAQAARARVEFLLELYERLLEGET